MRDDIYKNIKNFILSLEGYTKDIRIGVSYSGGADSGVLLHILKNLSEEGCISKPEVIYFNHNLRGEESLKEAEFVKRTCAGLRYKLICIGLEVKDHAGMTSQTLETAARELRYMEYKKLNCNYDYIAQGHHADDNAETVFFNILRGSGLDGAAGIKKVRDRFIRPLLGYTKADILEFARSNNIEFVEDSSNKSNDFSRNRIRNVIFPIIKKELNRDFISTLNSFANSIHEAGEYIYGAAERKFKKLVRVTGGIVIICKNRFLLLEPALRTAVLHKAVRAASESGYNIDSVKTGVIFANMKKITGKIFGTDELSISVHGNNIIIINRKKFDNKAKISISDSLRSEYFIDASKAKGKIMTSRIMPGDNFVPFGKKNEERINKVLSDKKIPLEMRKHLICLRDDRGLIFVQGAGISERVKTDDFTTALKYVKIKNDILKKLFF